jgi:hypothetical protein
MTRDEEAKNIRLFDVRTIERNIRKGLTTRKDYEKFLKSLPDVAEKAAPPDAYHAADDDLDDDDFDDEEDEIVEAEAAAAEEPGEPAAPPAPNGVPETPSGAV